jgi:holo-[acyl-carrier protein] synthase
MIIGVGVDLVDLTRFESAVTRTPKLVERLFTESEREANLTSLAGKFAAKEAFVKALGGADGMHWHDVEVAKRPTGAPYLVVTGETLEVAQAAGIKSFHVSISHDGGKAVSVVIAEGGE